MSAQEREEYQRNYYRRNRVRKYIQKRPLPADRLVWTENRELRETNQKLARAKLALRAKMRTDAHNAFSFVQDFS
jgi:hypothetical protein